MTKDESMLDGFRSGKAQGYREGFAAGAKAQREADIASIKRGVRVDMQPLVAPPEDAT